MSSSSGSENDGQAGQDYEHLVGNENIDYDDIVVDPNALGDNMSMSLVGNVL